MYVILLFNIPLFFQSETALNRRNFSWFFIPAIRFFVNFYIEKNNFVHSFSPITGIHSGY